MICAVAGTLSLSALPGAPASRQGPCACGVFLALCSLPLYLPSILPQTGIYKKLCIYSHMFKLQSPSKYSPFDAVHPWRHFTHCSEQFQNSLIWMPFSAFAIFCFTSSTSAKPFPLRTFFHPGKQKKSCLGWDRVNREGGAQGGNLFFSQKLLNTQRSVGRCTCKSPIMKCANMLRESSKKFHWSWTQLLTTTPAGALMQMGS